MNLLRVVSGVQREIWTESDAQGPGPQRLICFNSCFFMGHAHTQDLQLSR